MLVQLAWTYSRLLSQFFMKVFIFLEVISSHSYRLAASVETTLEFSWALCSNSLFSRINLYLVSFFNHFIVNTNSISSCICVGPNSSCTWAMQRCLTQQLASLIHLHLGNQLLVEWCNVSPSICSRLLLSYNFRTARRIVCTCHLCDRESAPSLQIIWLPDGNTNLGNCWLPNRYNPGGDG